METLDYYNISNSYHEKNILQEFHPEAAPVCFTDKETQRSKFKVSQIEKLSGGAGGGGGGVMVSARESERGYVNTWIVV